MRDLPLLSTTMVDLASRPLPSILLLALLPVAAWFVVRPFLDPVPPLPALYTCFGFSIFAFLATLYLVPALGPTFVKANLKGKDLLKVYHTPVYALFCTVWLYSQVIAAQRVLDLFVHRFTS